MVASKRDDIPLPSMRVVTQSDWASEPRKVLAQVDKCAKAELGHSDDACRSVTYKRC